MSASELRAIYALVAEIKQTINIQPRIRLHVAPDSATWVIIGIENSNLAQHVTVIPDPGITDAGKGWIEKFSPEEWMSLKSLVGTRVRVSSHRPYYPEDVVGELLSLTDKEAIVDDGAGNDGQYYLIWTTIKPEPVRPEQEKVS